ncbi:MAG: c-type cytochrome [Pararhodobacter sp.]
MKLTGLLPILAATLVLALPAGADEPTPLIAQGCAGCHGQAGEGAGSVPDIAGYDREAFVQTWAEFREGERFATIMTRIARGYTDEEVAELADYFSSLR